MNMGGLSLTRIATFTEFRRALLQFRTAGTPWGRIEVGTHGEPRFECDEDGTPRIIKREVPEKYAKALLGVIERLREQRVKQLASRIAEAALGIGRIEPGKNRDPKRPSDRVDASCHAIVIENLTNYRPEETRTRRENRQLMAWSSSKVKKYLFEACQLHDLNLHEVQAGYTSRQDSRTGAPGVRCADVPVAEFLTAPWWRREVNAAKAKTKNNKGTERDRYLCALEEKWSAANEATRRTAPPVRIPVDGGEIFVSTDPSSPAAQGTQADLNAAANIGLKALMDPDWTGKWWYVPAAFDDDGWRIPSPKSCAGAAWVEHWKVGQDGPDYTTDGNPIQLADNEDVKEAHEQMESAKAAVDAAKKVFRIAKKNKKASELQEAAAQCDQAEKAYTKAKKSYTEAKRGATAKEVINLWRNPVGADITSFAAGRPWREYSAYRRDVEYRVIRNVLYPRANLLIEKHSHALA